MNISDSRLTPQLSALAPQLTALRCTFLIALHHGQHLAPEALPAVVEGSMVASIQTAFTQAGFKTRLLSSCGWKKATSLGSAMPALAEMRGGNWVILVGALPAENGGVALAVLDPRREADGVHRTERAEFEAEWTGTLILARRAPALTDEGQPFGLRWFIPELLRQKRLLAGVAMAAIVANLIAFAIPLLLQVLIDRVVSHQAWNTLAVVVSIFVILATFDAIFTYVRQRLMLIAGGKVDARLGARAFSHLLSLPLSVFESTPAGVLARHIQQTEKLRNFLTGRLFQTLIDALLLPVLITLLIIYSPLLTAVVLVFAFLIAACIGMLLPVFRSRLTRLYTAEAEKQAQIIETLHNMRAVKALVLEPNRQKNWDASLVACVRRQWEVGTIAAVAAAVTGWLEKAMQISVLALGAVEVFEGNLGLGALVAFTMLSAKVTGPLIQIVGLINEYQEAALSVRMLATIMDRPSESAGQARPSRPNITGHLRFTDVGFSYPGASTPALNGISFEIVPDQIIGVVGRSGSGKTTVTRLIQGIEAPGSGSISLDGVDLRHIDIPHLRRNVGVVLQENLLFRGTVRDNIAAARPASSLESIVMAARLAGAEEFIQKLPMSYETPIEEGGANLSGGQRQRIAIARALLTAPRLLIFDEATSALDPESEAIVNKNLKDMAFGRTLIIVSHRLSSLVKSDAILVLDAGKVVDMAPHNVLLQRCEIYRSLWLQQTEYAA